MDDLSLRHSTGSVPSSGYTMRRMDSASLGGHQVSTVNSKKGVRFSPSRNRMQSKAPLSKDRLMGKSSISEIAAQTRRIHQDFNNVTGFLKTKAPSSLHKTLSPRISSTEQQIKNALQISRLPIKAAKPRRPFYQRWFGSSKPPARKTLGTAQKREQALKATQNATRGLHDLYHQIHLHGEDEAFREYLLINKLSTEQFDHFTDHVLPHRKGVSTPIHSVIHPPIKREERDVHTVVNTFFKAYEAFNKPPLLSSSSSPTPKEEVVKATHKALYDLMAMLQKGHLLSNNSAKAHVAALTQSQGLLTNAKDEKTLAMALKDANSSITAAYQFLFPPQVEEIE